MAKKSNFKGKFVSSAKKYAASSSGKTSSTIKLPKGFEFLQYDDKVKELELDFLPYIVTDKHHPLRDAEEGIALVGDQWFYRPYKVHRNIGADRTDFICPSSIGQKCPICEYQKELFKTDKEAAIALYPKDRCLYVVIPRNLSKLEEKPYVWDISIRLFHDILIEELEKDEDNESFAALEGGKTLTCKLKWKSFGEKDSKFAEIRAIDFDDRDDIDEAILEDLPKLDDTLNILSYDELYNAFHEIQGDGGKLEDAEDSDEEEEEVEENPVRERKTVDTIKTERKNEDKEEEKVKRNVEAANKKHQDTRESKEFIWKDLLESSFSALSVIVEERELDIDPMDYDDDVVALRKAIARELDITVVKAKEVVKEEPVKETKSTVTRTTKPAKKDDGDVCPEGFVFGVDTNKKDACDTCDLWDKCTDKQDELKKKK